MDTEDDKNKVRRNQKLTEIIIIIIITTTQKHQLSRVKTNSFNTEDLSFFSVA